MARETLGHVRGLAGVKIVWGRVGVERSADPYADSGGVQQRPDRGEPPVDTATVLAEARDHVLLVVDATVQRGFRLMRDLCRHPLPPP